MIAAINFLTNALTAVYIWPTQRCHSETAPSLSLSPQCESVQSRLGSIGEEWHPADDTFLWAWSPFPSSGICESHVTSYLVMHVMNGSSVFFPSGHTVGPALSGKQGQGSNPKPMVTYMARDWKVRLITMFKQLLEAWWKGQVPKGVAQPSTDFGGGGGVKGRGGVWWGFRVRAEVGRHITPGKDLAVAKLEYKEFWV